MTDELRPIETAQIGDVAANSVDVGSAIMLRRCVAVTALTLLGLTWRLWLPVTDFPQVPLIRAAGRLPVWCEWVGYPVMLAGLVGAFIARRSTYVWRAGLISFLFAFGVMALIDQHRLQPWAYQFALMAWVFVLVPASRTMGLLRVLTAGIYFHSALSKLDFSFLDSQGPYLLSGITRVVGISVTEWSPAVRRYLAASMPSTELLIAAGLCFRRTRAAALTTSVVMHAALIVALGPWSLAHELPVLVWNAYFIAQNVLLFGIGRRFLSFRALSPASPNDWLACVVIATAILLPFLLPFEWFDVWPSWAVYANGPARARVLVDTEAIGELPAELRQYVVKSSAPDMPCVLRIDRWSLEATNTPIYPQPRFQLGVAMALAAHPGLPDRIHVDLQSAADRWTGERTTQRISGINSLRLQADRFRLNAWPALVRARRIE